MSRKSEGARLYWRNRKDGKNCWEIRDSGRRISTGTDSRRDAEAALAEYIARKYRPTGPVAADELTVGMCLNIYAEEHAVNVASPERIGYAIAALDKFWGDLPCSSVRGETCRRYAKGRSVSDGTIRRELGTLQAALNHCHREGYLLAQIIVTLPPKPPARDRWMTRQEAAWLLRAARSLNNDGRHLQDFILHGLYTGSRKATILAMRINTPSVSGGHVDTVNGVLYRMPQGKRATKKRQTVSRIPARYLAHLRRQAANGRKFVVERQMRRGDRKERFAVGDIRKGWARAVVLAAEMAEAKGIQIDLTDVTPHCLKHTAITWMLQKGASIWDAAGYFGTSAETIEKHYGHHSPHHQKTAVDAMNRSA